MARRSDDEALQWDEPEAKASLVRPSAAAGAAKKVDPVVDESSIPAAAPAPKEPTREQAEIAAPLGNVALVAIGVVCGIYLLYAFGWFLGGARWQNIATLFIEPVVYLAAWALAVISPLLWFVAVWFGARGARPWQRALLLVLGIALLIPWPLLLQRAGA